jgi:hypothetical protein
MVGGDNARRGGTRLFDAFQSPRLNKHLVFTVFDEIVGALFPELARLGAKDAPGASALEGASSGEARPAAPPPAKPKSHARQSSASGSRGLLGLGTTPSGALEALAAASEAWAQHNGPSMLF